MMSCDYFTLKDLRYLWPICKDLTCLAMLFTFTIKVDLQSVVIEEVVAQAIADSF